MTMVEAEAIVSARIEPPVVGAEIDNDNETLIGSNDEDSDEEYLLDEAVLQGPDALEVLDLQFKRYSFLRPMRKNLKRYLKVYVKKKSNRKVKSAIKDASESSLCPPERSLDQTLSISPTVQDGHDRLIASTTSDVFQLKSAHAVNTSHNLNINPLLMGSATNVPETEMRASNSPPELFTNLLSQKDTPSNNLLADALVESSVTERVLDESKVMDADVNWDNHGVTLALEQGGQGSEIEQNQESNGAISMQSGAIKIGTLVEVASRTWPGINKPGGTAKITGATWDADEESWYYNVKYVLGGTEKDVDESYVRTAEPLMSTLESTRRRQQGMLGRCRYCASLVRDCGHSQEDIIAPVPSAASAVIEKNKANQHNPRRRRSRGQVGLDSLQTMLDRALTRLHTLNDGRGDSRTSASVLGTDPQHHNLDLFLLYGSTPRNTQVLRNPTLHAEGRSDSQEAEWDEKETGNTPFPGNSQALCIGTAKKIKKASKPVRFGVTSLKLNTPGVHGMKNIPTSPVGVASCDADRSMQDQENDHNAADAILLSIIAEAEAYASDVSQGYIEDDGTTDISRVFSSRLNGLSSSALVNIMHAIIVEVRHACSTFTDILNRVQNAKMQWTNPYRDNADARNAGHHGESGLSRMNIGMERARCIMKYEDELLCMRIRFGRAGKDAFEAARRLLRARNRPRSERKTLCTLHNEICMTATSIEFNTIQMLKQLERAFCDIYGMNSLDYWCMHAESSGSEDCGNSSDSSEDEFYYVLDPIDDAQRRSLGQRASEYMHPIKKNKREATSDGINSDPQGELKRKRVVRPGHVSWLHKTHKTRDAIRRLQAEQRRGLREAVNTPGQAKSTTHKTDEYPSSRSRVPKVHSRAENLHANEHVRRDHDAVEDITPFAKAFVKNQIKEQESPWSDDRAPRSQSRVRAGRNDDPGEYSSKNSRELSSKTSSAFTSSRPQRYEAQHMSAMAANTFRAVHHARRLKSQGITVWSPFADRATFPTAPESSSHSDANYLAAESASPAFCDSAMSRPQNGVVFQVEQSGYRCAIPTSLNSNHQMQSNEFASNANAKALQQTTIPIPLKGDAQCQASRATGGEHVASDRTTCPIVNPKLLERQHFSRLIQQQALISMISSQRQSGDIQWLSQVHRQGASSKVSELPNNRKTVSSAPLSSEKVVVTLPTSRFVTQVPIEFYASSESVVRFEPAEWDTTADGEVVNSLHALGSCGKVTAKAADADPQPRASRAQEIPRDVLESRKIECEAFLEDLWSEHFTRLLYFESPMNKQDLPIFENTITKYYEAIFHHGCSMLQAVHRTSVSANPRTSTKASTCVHIACVLSETSLSHIYEKFRASHSSHLTSMSQPSTSMQGPPNTSETSSEPETCKNRYIRFMECLQTLVIHLKTYTQQSNVFHNRLYACTTESTTLPNSWASQRAEESSSLATLLWNATNSSIHDVMLHIILSYFSNLSNLLTEIACNCMSEYYSIPSIAHDDPAANAAWDQVTALVNEVSSFIAMLWHQLLLAALTNVQLLRHALLLIGTDTKANPSPRSDQPTDERTGGGLNDDCPMRVLAFFELWNTIAIGTLKLSKASNSSRKPFDKGAVFVTSFYHRPWSPLLSILDAVVTTAGLPALGQRATATPSLGARISVNSMLIASLRRLHFCSSQVNGARTNSDTSVSHVLTVGKGSVCVDTVWALIALYSSALHQARLWAGFESKPNPHWPLVGSLLQHACVSFLNDVNTSFVATEALQEKTEKILAIHKDIHKESSNRNALYVALRNTAALSGVWGDPQGALPLLLDALRKIAMQIRWPKHEHMGSISGMPQHVDNSPNPSSNASKGVNGGTLDEAATAAAQWAVESMETFEMKILYYIYQQRCTLNKIALSAASAQTRSAVNLAGSGSGNQRALSTTNADKYILHIRKLVAGLCLAVGVASPLCKWFGSLLHSVQGTHVRADDEPVLNALKAIGDGSTKDPHKVSFQASLSQDQNENFQKLEISILLEQLPLALAYVLHSALHPLTHLEANKAKTIKKRFIAAIKRDENAPIRILLATSTTDPALQPQSACSDTPKSCAFASGLLACLMQCVVTQFLGAEANIHANSNGNSFWKQLLGLKATKTSSPAVPAPQSTANVDPAALTHELHALLLWIFALCSRPSAIYMLDWNDQHQSIELCTPLWDLLRAFPALLRDAQISQDTRLQDVQTKPQTANTSNMGTMHMTQNVMLSNGSFVRTQLMLSLAAGASAIADNSNRIWKDFASTEHHEALISLGMVSLFNIVEFAAALLPVAALVLTNPAIAVRDKLFCLAFNSFLVVIQSATQTMCVLEYLLDILYSQYSSLPQANATAASVPSVNASSATTFLHIMTCIERTYVLMQQALPISLGVISRHASALLKHGKDQWSERNGSGASSAKLIGALGRWCRCALTMQLSRSFDKCRAGAPDTSILKKATASSAVITAFVKPILGLLDKMCTLNKGDQGKGQVTSPDSLTGIWLKIKFWVHLMTALQKQRYSADDSQQKSDEERSVAVQVDPVLIAWIFQTSAQTSTLNAHNGQTAPEIIFLAEMHALWVTGSIAVYYDAAASHAAEFEQFQKWLGSLILTDERVSPTHSKLLYFLHQWKKAETLASVQKYVSRDSEHIPRVTRAFLNGLSAWSFRDLALSVDAVSTVTSIQQYITRLLRNWGMRAFHASNLERAAIIQGVADIKVLLMRTISPTRKDAVFSADLYKEIIERDVLVANTTAGAYLGLVRGASDPEIGPEAAASLNMLRDHMPVFIRAASFLPYTSNNKEWYALLKLLICTASAASRWISPPSPSNTVKVNQVNSARAILGAWTAALLLHTRAAPSFCHSHTKKTAYITRDTLLAICKQCTSASKGVGSNCVGPACVTALHRSLCFDVAKSLKTEDVIDFNADSRNMDSSMHDHDRDGSEALLADKISSFRAFLLHSTASSANYRGELAWSSVASFYGTRGKGSLISGSRARLTIATAVVAFSSSSVKHANHPCSAFYYAQQPQDGVYKDLALMSILSSLYFALQLARLRLGEGLLDIDSSILALGASLSQVSVAEAGIELLSFVGALIVPMTVSTVTASSVRDSIALSLTNVHNGLQMAQSALLTSWTRLIVCCIRGSIQNMQLLHLRIQAFLEDITTCALHQQVHGNASTTMPQNSSILEVFSSCNTATCSCVVCCNTMFMQDINIHIHAISNRLATISNVLDASALGALSSGMHSLDELQRREETLGPSYKSQAEELSALACAAADLHDQNL